MGNLHLIEEYAWTPEDYKVSEVMQNYFANFILTGDPNGDELPLWEPAAADDPNPPVMVLDTESKLIRAEHDNRYLFLDRNYGNDK
jgi:para-nitrobenzyl esterase